MVRSECRAQQQAPERRARWGHPGRLELLAHQALLVLQVTLRTPAILVHLDHLALRAPSVHPVQPVHLDLLVLLVRPVPLDRRSPCPSIIGLGPTEILGHLGIVVRREPEQLDHPEWLVHLELLVLQDR